MNTSLNKIRKHSPCEDSWKKLLLSLSNTEADDEPVSIQYILDELGIKDAIWALRSLEGADREIRLFACDCAESVLHIFEEKYPDDKRPRQAIELARSYAMGEASDEDLQAAWAAVGSAARAARAAGSAVGSAAWAARADALDEGDAARAAAWAEWAARADALDAGDAELKKQENLFRKYFCK